MRPSPSFEPDLARATMASPLHKSALIMRRRVGWRVVMAGLLCAIASAASATPTTCTNPQPGTMNFGTDALFSGAFGCQTLTAIFAPGFDSSHTYVFDFDRFEDTLSFGYGAEIAARIADELFSSLDAPVRRVGALDTWIGYHPHLEAAILPQTETLVNEMDRLLAW